MRADTETRAVRFAFVSSLHTPVMLSLTLAITRRRDLGGRYARARGDCALQDF